VSRLPLFPLPIVLLPGTALPLHIFEMRYRKMVAHCRDQDTPFGLIYHDPDLQGPFLIEPGRVGTEAYIEVFHPLPDGRSLILIRGRQRFRIREEIASAEPYYEALVDPYEDQPRAPGTEAALRGRRRTSSDLLHRAVDAVGGERDAVPDPDLERDVSFQLARSLQIAPSWLQALLELRDELTRLERLDVIFRAAIEGRRPGADEFTGEQ
jgi:Lon protease-like protein